MLKFAIVISIVCLQTLLINAENNGIQLGWLATGELINWGQCDKDGPWMEFHGAFGHFYTIVHSESSAKCMDDNWILDWDKEDLGRSENNRNCLPVPASNQIGDCKTCPCIGSSSLDGNFIGLNRFSLRAQESDIANKKVVTGVRFVSGSRAIYLQIQQATLQLNGQVKDDKEWVPVPVKQEADYEMSGRSVTGDEFHVTWDKRTVHLDELILPTDHCITGVKFAPTPSGKGIQLEIRGTEYDNSGNLFVKSHSWYSANHSLTADESYNRPREEINLKNSKDSALAPENNEIKTTNHFVRFRAASVTEKMIFPTIPRLSTTATETQDSSPLQGLKLTYEGHAGYGGYITLKKLVVTDVEYPECLE